MARFLRPVLALLLLSLPLFDISVEVSATTMTFYNKCTHPVWPGIQPSAGQPILARGGFKLLPNKSYSLRLPPGWSGRMWGRHGCSFDKNGRGRCATGDCGGALFCNGIGGTPPATLAEITLGKDQDFYDVSLVDGYNLAISVTPFRGSGKCSYAGCVSDLNNICPVGLQVRSPHDNRIVACKSACSAFNSARYCCTGSFATPQSCKPTAYSKIFKSACPKAYSYAYDDPTSIATCTGGSYLVTFGILPMAAAVVWVPNGEPLVEPPLIKMTGRKRSCAEEYHSYPTISTKKVCFRSGDYVFSVTDTGSVESIPEPENADDGIHDPIGHPADKAEWVDSIIKEMTNATSVDDAKSRASRMFDDILEKFKPAAAGAGKAQNLTEEKFEAVDKENSILKRAVVIQHQRQKEYERKDLETKQLKELVEGYQNQVKSLEANNYALTIHLQQALRSSSIPTGFSHVF